MATSGQLQIALLAAVFVTIITLHTCTGQIKFDAMRVMTCNTCEDETSNAACNQNPQPCPNPDDACISVVWSYPNGRQRHYKRCVSRVMCRDEDRVRCMGGKNARQLQQCSYCCYGARCNTDSVAVRAARLDQLFNY